MVGVIEDVDVDVWVCVVCVVKWVWEELDARERERGARLEALAERWSEVVVVLNRVFKVLEKKNFLVFLMGVVLFLSKYVNFVCGGKALDEGAVKATKRLAFEIL